MRLAIAITFLAATICAQPGPGLPYYAGGVNLGQPPCVGGNGYPTNILGYPAYGWYIACGGYGTNAGIATWTNLTSTAGLNLTNAYSDGAVQGPTLNGLGTLSFEVGSDAANQSLQNNGYSVASSSEFEVFMVAAITNGSSRAFWADAGQASFDGMTAGIGLVTGTKFQLYAASAGVNVCDPLTNTWAVFDFVMTGGASSTIYTNNVQGLSGNPGTAGLPHGFEIAPHLQGATMAVAELLTYRTNLTTALRSNVWWTLKTRYGL